MKTVVVFAGSDSSGGAGLQGDQRALAAFGVHPLFVVTAVTAQDSHGVRGVWPVPVEVVLAQARAVLDDIGADAVKVGLLPSADVAAAVADLLDGLVARDGGGSVPVVVDPVGVASSGDPLAAPGALDVLRDRVIARATVVTPNVPEVTALTGWTGDDLEAAARAVQALGPRWTVVTGGHLAGDPVDLLWDGATARRYPGERVATAHTHGTGCAFASALAAGLALGRSVPDAVGEAKAYVTAALRRGYPLGSGVGPIG